MARWNPVHVTPTVMLCMCIPSFTSQCPRLCPKYHFLAFLDLFLQEETCQGGKNISVKNRPWCRMCLL